MVFSSFTFMALVGAAVLSAPQPTAVGVTNSTTNVVQALRSTNRPKIDGAVPTAAVVVSVDVVEPSEPISLVVAPLPAAEREKAISMAIADVLRMVLANAVELNVPEVIVANIANATKLTIPDVLAEACSQAAAIMVADVSSASSSSSVDMMVADVSSASSSSSVDIAVSGIAAAIYAKLAALTVPDMPPAEIVKIQNEWYEKFSAVSGSRLYWILKLARDKAAKGESVEELKKLFDESMERSLSREEE